MQLLKMKFGESYHIFFGFLGLHFYDNTSGTVFPAPFKIKKPGFGCVRTQQPFKTLRVLTAVCRAKEVAFDIC